MIGVGRVIIVTPGLRMFKPCRARVLIIFNYFFYNQNLSCIPNQNNKNDFEKIYIILLNTIEITKMIWANN